MAIQQEIAFKFGDSLIGYELDAIIDSQVEEGVYLGRIFADAPEIDGNIYVTGEGINIGDMIPVEIVDRQDYDLIGLYHGDEDKDDSVESDPSKPWEPGQN
jgi:ribosomal protein S12 methylthiotransferase